MKIKKIITTIFLLLVMILPIAVIAETCDSNSVKIESIKVKAANGNAKEVTEATKNGTAVNVDLDMLEVGDSIVYETVVKNSSNEDYYLDESYLIVDTDYMEYSITSEDDSNLIPASSSKNFDIKVKYRKAVDDAAYVSGKYTDTNNLLLSLQTESKNPFTADYIAIYLSIFYLSVFVLMYLFIKRKKIEETVILLLVALLLPLSVNALCKTQITVNSKVNIEKKELSTFHLECSPIEFKFYKGMTFGEWIKSSLYEGNIDGDYESLETCESIFGSNRGCAYDRTEKPYYIKNSYFQYRTTIDDCNDLKYCEEINNQLYRARFAYYVYDTLEQCKANHDESVCTLNEGKYMFMDSSIHQTEEECNNYISSRGYPYGTCSIIPIIYREEVFYYSYYNTLEECELYKPEGKECIQQVIDYYKPTIRETDYETKGVFKFQEKSGFYDYDGGVFGFYYNDVIKDDVAYGCGHVA